MPTSEYAQIPKVVEVIARLAPHTVLDVGAGYGKYGVLAREYAPASRVDAIDAHPPRYPVYDHVYVGDLRQLDALLPKDAPRYDLSLFLDVIEHLDKPDAYALTDRLVACCERVLITTPWGFRPQEIPGMPFETHRSGWYPWHFSSRYRVHEWRAFPGHYTRHLKLPRLWQLLVVVSAKG